MDLLISVPGPIHLKARTVRSTWTNSSNAYNRWTRPRRPGSCMRFRRCKPWRICCKGKDHARTKQREPRGRGLKWQRRASGAGDHELSLVDRAIAILGRQTGADLER